MSFNWKRSVLVGIAVFIYLTAMNKFCPNLNPFWNFLVLVILVAMTVQLLKSIVE